MAERGDRFLLLFALAAAGGMVAYVPLLTLVLPVRVADVATDAHVAWLAVATLAGAIAASLANIGFGYASDRIGTRRPWAAAGLCLTVASYPFVFAAASPAGLVAAIVIFQVALNMLIAPLAAWAAEVVPDRRKGLLGGLLGAGPLIGALAGVVATLPAFPEPWMQMVVICALVVMLTAPLLLSRRPSYPREPAFPSAMPRRAPTRNDFVLLWFARLLVQVAGNVMFGFLLFYFETLPGALLQAGVARLAALALLLAFPIGLVCGALSDRLGRRKPFLVAAAGAGAAGLGLMASATQLVPSAIGYVLFGCGSGVFLALHSGYAMQLLPSPAHRGRDLGILNLTNTLPAIAAPLLAMWLVPGRGFGLLLALLAGLLLLSACCILFVRHDAQTA